MVGEKYVLTLRHRDKLNTVVYSYRTSFYLKDSKIDLKMTKYQTLLAN